ncbi:XRE family transcriptional regulator [Dactylosporangium aurantiacum]|uniref:XRE family transcriptional regulator n=2 Tax=Dactylosporangium aurantiacum TaxID=35754 RepID=UPI001FE1D4EE|nr:XRE family transcriptional regulator [Dactylosporangium aurantiacum]MDG6110531.1 XRE family transcriptional regulator [Dactylosporangium aurantiacum]
MADEQRDAVDVPGWSRRIRAERTARGWSQSQAVEALRAHAGENARLAEKTSLLRNWKRWEAGDAEPDAFYKPLVAETFGTVTAAFFPAPRPEHPAVLGNTGMDTLELISRLRVSDVSPAVLEGMHAAVEQLNNDYSHMEPAVLVEEGQRWLNRLIALHDGRLSLEQHREVLSLAGQVARLVGCVEYDMGRKAAAEATRRAALTLGKESGDSDVVGWAHEMRSWYSLTEGNYRAAIAAARAGLEAVGPGHSVTVQLWAHQAKAWARIGDRRQVEVALDNGRAILEALPYPENPGNHFVIDPSKWDFYTMDCYRHVGEDRLAATYAEEVIRTGTTPDGVVRRPMRVAEAHITLGIVAARQGELEAALAAGRTALALDRKSLPSLVMHSRELVAELDRRFAGDQRVVEYVDLLRSLAN